jgi:hypothetical protein
MGYWHEDATLLLWWHYDRSAGNESEPLMADRLTVFPTTLRMTDAGR